jgi:hypothetical protein
MDIISDLLYFPKLIFHFIYNFIYFLFTNQIVLLIITIIIIFYVFFFIGLGKSSSSKSYTLKNNYTFKNNNVENSNVEKNTLQNNNSITHTKQLSYSNTNMNIIFIIIFIIFIILFISFLYHNNLLNVLNFSTYTQILNPLSNEPQIIIDLETNSPASHTLNIPQVFNIPGNYYKYDEAQSLCQAYGSRLANYTDLEKAYNNGAEWCNYGWSDGQMALFPTQAETYKNLQKIPGHEHDCGRPGINGGYIANPNVRFGVNCFGNKPKMSPEEEELMATTSPYPLTKQDIEMEEQVQFWKNRLPDILVSPFNYNNWSKV